MRNTKSKMQVQFEPGYFYHIGLPFNLKNMDPTVFESGYHFGQFASYMEIEKGTYRAVRDPLGIGKLFYTETKDGELHFSNKFADLFPYKSAIYSVPAGMLVDISSGGRRRLIHQLSVSPKTDDSMNLDAFEKDNSPVVEKFRQRFDNRLNTIFRMLRNLEDEGWSFFIALSGGLDSSIIASKSAQHLKKPIACTLDLGKSEDSEKSKQIAEKLGIKHFVFPTNEDEILSTLDDAPLLCQDFRDFNVHCAALNILLAKNIKRYIESSKDIDKEKVIVLTGDLMNEFTCDYAGEVLDGVEYYRLPRVNKKELQRILIKGLDTSDREISVFNEYGLKCIQPFAALYDLYDSIPESVLRTENQKKILNSFLVDSVILDFIPKVKLRAQVGSRENMGILGICHYKGITNETFHKKLLKDSGYNDGSIPIFAGSYEIEEFTKTEIYTEKV